MRTAIEYLGQRVELNFVAESDKQAILQLPPAVIA